MIEHRGQEYFQKCTSSVVDICTKRLIEAGTGSEGNLLKPAHSHCKTSKTHGMSSVMTRKESGILQRSE